MHKFWHSIIQPLFDIIQPREIVEIGADYGLNTHKILAYCRQTDSHAHIIDPLPKFDPDLLRKEYGEVFTFYPSLSLNALPLIDHMDAVLIDGDHNWYTVYHELKLIEKKVSKTDAAFPIIFIHDVAWPYARRDMYYHPDNIPEPYRLPYTQKGIDPGGTGLIEKGGLNPHLNNAIYEHNFRNGVLTAIEDFLKETDFSVELVKVPIFHGLGILYSAYLKTSLPSFVEFTQSLAIPPIISRLFGDVESSRIKNIIATEQISQMLRHLEKTRHQEFEENQRMLHKSGQQIESLEKVILTIETQLKMLEEKRKNESRQYKDEIEANKIKILELEEKRHSERDSYQQQIEQHQQKIKSLTQSKDTLRRERDQLSQWIKRLRSQFDALMRSRRWRLGHALVGIVTLSVFRRNFTMASDHMKRIFQEFNYFNPSDDSSPQIEQVKKNAFPKRKYNLTVAVIAWDIGHNPVGRAYMLAEALSRYFHVALLGPSFPRYNDRVWEPLGKSEIEILPLLGKDFPEFLAMLEKASKRIEADIIIACKARLPSVQLGLMMKQFKNRPLFIDVDDYELSFFQNRGGLFLSDLRSSKNFSDLSLPFEETWTRFTEGLLGYADGIFVASNALKKKFGGIVIPHARNEMLFDPSLYDKNKRRKELGIDAHWKVVLFLGTPREHKGVTEVLTAIKSLNKPEYKLCVIGTPPDRHYENKLRRIGGNNLMMLPDQSFSSLAENLVIADLVCLIQNPSSSISHYQLPAKVVDALAMGIPVLATRTEPLESLINDGVVYPISESDLGISIDRILSDSDKFRLSQIKNRNLFLKNYSYDAIAEKLYPVLLDSISKPKPLPSDALDFLDTQKQIPPKNIIHNPNLNEEGLDIVLFWKQNDIGVYGRRSDMLIKYLSYRPQIRKIAVFGMPIAAETLREKSRSKGIVQDRMVYKETLLGNWGIRDSGKISFHTFIYNMDRKDRELQLWKYPDKSGYMAFVEDRLNELGIQSNQSIFWFYPQNSNITQIVKYFNPKLRVIDLVDDHRTWSELTEIKRLSITKHYKEVLKLGDLVIANCRNVQQSLKKFNPNIKLIPNGCELLPPPTLLKDKEFHQYKMSPGPKLGYVGNLEKDKIDTELIQFIAEKRPTWNIFLIGSAHANPQVLELKKFSNVHFLGVIQYPEVRGWISEFDVAILPHMNSEKTRSMNPLKLYVYCSLGIPVVSTDIENLDELKPFISIANSYADFDFKVEQAIRNGKKDISSELKECLTSNTWDKRIDQILNELKVMA